MMTFAYRSPVFVFIFCFNLLTVAIFVYIKKPIFLQMIEQLGAVHEQQCTKCAMRGEGEITACSACMLQDCQF
jgi:hypothetical protein